MSQASASALPGVPGLEDDAEGARVVAEELRLLSTVIGALDAASGADLTAARGRVLDEERMLQIRDEVATAKPEDLPALFEQMHHLGALRAQRGRGATGSIDRASPYFAHVRLEEQDPDGKRPRRRDVLIGARSYLDPGGGVRIVDWRQAPVSRIYYRYGEGDDYEEELGERPVVGVVAVRRGVTIAGGELVRVASPQGTFVRGRDGRWKRASVQHARLETERRREARLGAGGEGALRADKHLPAIASLLDARQFELIERDAAGLVAIQGSAGSGKTTVGLHRVAYLAFREPGRFRPERMFVVVPNEALIHYVSRVLPSLGIEGVPVTTFARFAARQLMHLFPKLPQRTSEETPAVVSRMKSHGAMLRRIDRLVARVGRDLDEKIRSAMARWPAGEQVVAAWVAAGAEEGAAAPDARLSLLAGWLAGKRRLAGVPGGPDAARLPDVTRAALEPLIASARGQTRSVADLWDELLTSREGLGEAFANEPGFGPAQLDQAHAWCVRQARIRAEADRDGEQPSIDAEDRALLLRAWQVLRGPLVDGDAKPIRFAHLFVDEVQDSSPVELRVLLELAGKDRCITLAGDTAQRMLDEGDERGGLDWNALLDDLGVPHTRLEPLRVSYRSTAEITRFARSVLGPLAHEEEPVTTREGPPVRAFGFASPGEAVAWLAEVLKQLASDEPGANVALVARFPQQADVYYDGLLRAEVPQVRRVAHQDFSWEAGVDVTDVRQTKGLEFDEVVLLETTATSYPATPHARRVLYVGATRAAHQLWCVASDAPSALVTTALAEQGGEIE